MNQDRINSLSNIPTYREQAKVVMGVFKKESFTSIFWAFYSSF